MQDTETFYKSVSLEDEELLKLKELVAKFPTQEVAAEKIGLTNRITLGRILKYNTCNSRTLSIIRTYLQTHAA